MQATGLVKGTENRWPDLAQVGGANDQLVRHPASWPRFLPGTADVDGTAQKPFWVRNEDGHFVNVADDLWPDMTAPTRGIAIADVDGSGYPDMVLANFWDNSIYIKNNGSGNKFIELFLLLPTVDNMDESASIRVHDGHPVWREGTPAIGAFVEIETPDGHKQIRQSDGGNGHSGQRSPEVRFGLGKTQASAIQVRISWRDLHGTLHHDAMMLAPGSHTVLLSAKGTNS